MTLRQPFSAVDEGAALRERPAWPMNVHLEARLERRLDPVRLAAAVDAALRQHPMAGARLVPQRALSGTLEWELPDETDGPVLVRGSDVSDLLSQSLPLALSPRLRIMLDQDDDGPDRSRLVLSTHHAALDATAAMTLLRTIAQEYAGTATPPAPAAPPAPVAPPGSVLAAVRSMRRSRPVDRVWFPGPAAASAGAAAYGVSSSELDDDTERALAEGRPPGLSVDDVLVSALHLALDSWNRQHGGSAGLFSVVSQAAPGAGPTGPAAGPAVSAQTFTRANHRSVPAVLLEAVQAQLAAAVAPPAAPELALSGLPVTVRRRLSVAASAVTRDRAMATTQLVNLGRQQRLLPAGSASEEFPVSSLLISPPCRPPQPFVVGAVSLDRTTTLTARWCRPEFDQATADRLLGELVRCLRVVLGIDSKLGDDTPDQADAADAAQVPLLTGMRRTLHYGKLFREEQQQPEAFYRFLARDTVAQIQRYRSVAGARALDIGGGPGYLADALEAEGARCDVVDYSGEELYLFGRDPNKSLIGDGCRLPVKDGCLDLVVSSNVLEHVPYPSAFLREAVRVLKPDGLAYIAFTNWFSPWGGHETSPWHYLGGDRAAARYERMWSLPPKNKFAESLFAVHVGQTLRWVREQPGLHLVDAFPRYLPRWMRPLLLVPGVREVVTWNLVMILAPVADSPPLSRPTSGSLLDRPVPAVV